MLLRQIYNADLSQYAYIIGCEKTREAIVIDPERDVDRYLAMATDEGLKFNAVGETHIRADFVSGARELARDPAMRGSFPRRAGRTGRGASRMSPCCVTGTRSKLAT